MANKLIALGDSFTYGSDLADTEFNGRPSDHTWPALLANSQCRDYVCLASPGACNSRIARHYWAVRDTIDKEDLVVVNWSWIDRWEHWDEHAKTDWYQTYVDSDGDTWKQQRPGDSSHTYYWKHLHSERQDKWNSLVFIQSVISDLTSREIPFILTCIDALLLDRQWHCPNFVETLQQQVEKHMIWFDNQSFLNWSQQKGFEISKSLHPLENAHKHAFEYIENEIAK